MKLFAYLLASISVFFFSCTPENPTPNGPNTDLPRVTIGSQIWSSKNLDVDRYRNGDPIPQITNRNEWLNASSGAWCWYGFSYDSINSKKYGKLYNWYAINDPRGIAPQGWHVPTDLEWGILATYLGGESLAGGPLKETGILNWYEPNSGATNSTGFTALPGGAEFDASSSGFAQGASGFWWSKTENNFNESWCRILVSNSNSVSRSSRNKKHGFSVRLVKD